MKISPTVLKLMLAGTSGLGLAAGAAFAMTPAPDAPITISDNVATPIETQSAPAPMELVPPESLNAPVELGARIEVAPSNASPSEPPKDESPTEEAPDETAPVPTPTPAPQPPSHNDCPACGMG